MRCDTCGEEMVWIATNDVGAPYRVMCPGCERGGLRSVLIAQPLPVERMMQIQSGTIGDAHYYSIRSGCREVRCTAPTLDAARAGASCAAMRVWPIEITTTEPPKPNRHERRARTAAGGRRGE